MEDMFSLSLSSFDTAVKKFFGRSPSSSILSDYVMLGSDEIVESETEGEVTVYSKEVYTDTSRFYMDTSECLLVPFHHDADGERVILVPGGARYRWSSAYVQLKKKNEISLRFLALFLEWSLSMADCICTYDSRNGKTEITLNPTTLLELPLPDVDIETQGKIVDLREGIRILKCTFSDRLMSRV